MNMYDIIMKKRQNQKLTKEEIEYFIKGYVKEDIPDYQASALLMACFINGLDFDETANLTMSMVNSGDVVDLSGIDGIKADKHSTGGVGDTTTLIVAPLVACAGIKLAKMSGRGLGHTGGTIDKLQSIPSFNTDLSMDEFIGCVNDIGISVIGQTMELVPADKKLYALRDVTATIESIPLIASSIMSKKIASGADVIVLDVKLGAGAFMKTLEQARSLAETMVEIGDRVGRKTAALITDMNQPLGQSVGNTLDVIEAIDVLKGEAGGDLKEVAFELAANILVLCDKASCVDVAKEILQQKIDDKSALEKLRQMIKAQHGNADVVDDYNLFDKAKQVYSVKAKEKGYISNIDALKVGRASCAIGAGRKKKTDIIDLSVGIIVDKRVGDSVDVGECLFEIQYNDKEKLQECLDILADAVVVSDKKVTKHKIIYEVITK